MNIFNDLRVDDSPLANNFHFYLRMHGVDFASGVPCGVLRHIIFNLKKDENILHVPANRESEAIGLAAGAYLGGLKPVIYMQNSGLFAASNDIASLLLLCRIPVLMLVSLRGAPGETAPQHFITGKSTIPLLESFGISYFFFDSIDISDRLNKSFEIINREKVPVVLLFERGWQNGDGS